MDELEHGEPLPTTPSVGGSNTEPPTKSLIEALRSEFDEVVSEANKVKYLSVVGYSKTGLQVKYRMPEKGKDLDEITRRVFRQVNTGYERNLLIGMDTMALLCDGLYVQLPEMDEPVELDPQEMGFPVKFDPRLVETMGWEGMEQANSRSIIRKLFNNNELYINSHCEKLFTWLRGTRSDLEEQFWAEGN